MAAVIFPPQIYSGPDHCIFEVRSLEAIRAAFAPLRGRRLRRVAGTIVGWVHSHPGLGLFLSRTDIGTFANWRQLDGEAVAVVVDPLMPGTDADRVAYWYHEQERTGLMVTSVASARDALTSRDGAMLAERIKQVAHPGGGWEIITAHHVVSVFPQQEQPAGNEAPQMAVQPPAHEQSPAPPPEQIPDQAAEPLVQQVAEVVR